MKRFKPGMLVCLGDPAQANSGFISPNGPWFDILPGMIGVYIELAKRPAGDHFLDRDIILFEDKLVACFPGVMVKYEYQV